MFLGMKAFRTLTAPIATLSLLPSLLSLLTAMTVWHR